MSGAVSGKLSNVLVFFLFVSEHQICVSAVDIFVKLSMTDGVDDDLHEQVFVRV